MGAMLKKLHSRRGASMVMALLMLLVCTMVGGVALTAASVSIGQHNRSRQTQQDQLAVLSAVNLIREDLNGLTFTGVYAEVVTTTELTDVDEDGNVIVVGYDVDTTYRISDAGDPICTRLSGSRLLEASGVRLDRLFYTRVRDEILGAQLNISGVDALCAKCTLTFPADDARKIPAVYGRVTISEDGKYVLTVQLSLDEKLLADATADQADIVTTMVFQPTYAWPPTLSRSSGSNPVNYYYTASVTWSTPKIYKGAVA